jgi:hypothetical protein
MNCPDDFRLATLSFAGLSMILVLTASVGIRGSKASELNESLYLTRLSVASLSVGIGFLVGVYVSEYFGGMGKLSPMFVVGLPVIATLVHFPPKRFILMILPVGFFGFVSLIAVAFMTGIPLD